MEVTTSVEDYLKTIWKLGSRGARVTPSGIAAARSVSGPSASVMVRRLVEADLLERGPAGDVRLTGPGEAAALRVVRRHRLLETFLVEVCGLPWDEVDEEAEVLEHVLSPRLEARIDELLGHPLRDPHGDPIPGPRAAPHVEDWSDPLAGAPVGSRFEVQRVSDRDPEALRHLAESGIRPGVVLRIQRLEPFGGPLWVTPLDPDAGAATDPAAGDPSSRDTGLPPALVELIHGRALAP